MTPAVVLAVGGSDSGGGAGIQADLKTFAALGVFGTSAVTAVTAQNTNEVRGVHVLPAAFVRAQVETVLDDLPVATVKTGMLASCDIVRTVAELAAAHDLPNLVVDPVLVASTGRPLVEPDAVALYRDHLFPYARVVTPNLWEAGVLLGREVHTLADQRAAAVELAHHADAVVVVKGGHPADDHPDDAVDVVVVDADVHELAAPRVDTANNHGSGCTFASAIAAWLATGRDPLDAVAAAKTFVHAAIAGGAHWDLGAGHGPLDHFRWEDNR